MKKVFILCIAFCSGALMATANGYDYPLQVLNFSAHSAALGGVKATLIDADGPNPASMARVYDVSLGGEYVDWLANTNVKDTSLCLGWFQFGTLRVKLTTLNIQYTEVERNTEGELEIRDKNGSAKDVKYSLGWGYDLLSYLDVGLNVSMPGYAKDRTTLDLGLIYRGNLLDFGIYSQNTCYLSGRNKNFTPPRELGAGIGLYFRDKVYLYGDLAFSTITLPQEGLTSAEFSYGVEYHIFDSLEIYGGIRQVECIIPTAGFALDLSPIKIGYACQFHPLEILNSLTLTINFGSTE